MFVCAWTMPVMNKICKKNAAMIQLWRRWVPEIFVVAVFFMLGFGYSLSDQVGYWGGDVASDP
jgi:hypothetical protein